MSAYKNLLYHLESICPINTHSHAREDEMFCEMSLDKILLNSYVSWSGEIFDESRELRERYLEKVRYKSYFISLQRALQSIYDFSEPISADNWDEISSKIREAYKAEPKRHINLFKELCRYESVILDAYWQPGDDNGYPGFFTPTFRVNMFMYAYDDVSADHNDTSAIKFFGRKFTDIDEYIFCVKDAISQKKASGCVALKSALAYDRGLNFEKTTKEKAQRVFKSGYSQEDVKAFQDYVFFEICKIAAELDLPFQNHTGLGILKDTNAMQLFEAIKHNPETKFVLFHGGYPWSDDICALTHKMPNVYPDICWQPIISPTSAKRLLHELIEVATSDKICWGCDCWTPEESFGALISARQVIASTLAEKVESAYFSLNDAIKYADKIMHDNALKLYYK